MRESEGRDYGKDPVFHPSFLFIDLYSFLYSHSTLLLFYAMIRNLRLILIEIFINTFLFSM